MFEMSWWKLIYAAVGLIGVTGTIAVFAIWPAVFKLLLDLVVRCFSFVLSYRIGCAVAAAILAAIAADYWRHSRDDAAFAERTAAFEQAQAERDAGIERDTELRVRQQIADEKVAEQGAKEDVKDFKDRLPPDDAFRVGADAGKLCKLAGQTECGPPKVLPQASGKSAAADHRVGNRLSRLGRRSLGRFSHRKPAHQRPRAVRP